MPRDPRYDILFEPVRIGPLDDAESVLPGARTATGWGTAIPRRSRSMRGVKAEGGWAVVCTEEVEIHPSSEVAPYMEGRLWDDADIPALARMVEKVHEHGSLAGIELSHNGMTAPTCTAGTAPLALRHLPALGHGPVQSARMDLADIDDCGAGTGRRWGARSERVRPRLRLRGARAEHNPALPRSPAQRAPTGTAAPLEQPFRLLARCSKTRWRRWPAGPRSPAGSWWTGSSVTEGSGAARSRVLAMVGELPDLWDFRSASGKTTRSHRGLQRRAPRSRTFAG